MTGIPLFVLIAAEVLTLDRVLTSVERSDPSLLAALQEREAAAGRALEARGEFDTKVSSISAAEPAGPYISRRSDFKIEQQTAAWGLSVESGYRLGRGLFAPYDGKLETRSAGEVYTGMRLPLLRGGSTDAARTAIRVSELGNTLAGASAEEQRLAVYRAAARRYWDWVAAGHRVATVRELLRLAEERDRQIAESADAGQIATIEKVENRRLIVQRQGELIAAGRALEQAAIDLSLFWRDSSGEPLLAMADELPASFPAVEAAGGAAELRSVVERRPDVRAAAVERDQAAAEVRLAGNQLLPTLDLYATYIRGNGDGRPTLRQNEAEAGIILNLPLQRRKARGKQQTAAAKFEQAAQKLRLARDRVVAGIRDAESALAAARERIGLARQEVEMARTLESAERERFGLGDSTLFVVNLRELAAAEAEFRSINASADYWRARADYSAATAEWLK